jgi:glycosyltransferase involved in cell wall biosynthesis
MRIALIADAFPPLRTSGAVQLRDLTRELKSQGHSVTVFLPDADQADPWRVECYDGATVVRLRALRTKDVGYLRRALGEMCMPFFMARNLRRSPLARDKWDGVVWYSPSIFHGYVADALKRSSGCRGYLIIRDIFPEWAVDMGLMGKGLAYRLFAAVARYQYSVADVIGIQTPGNRVYFQSWLGREGRRIEVLPNWLGGVATSRCPIRLVDTRLSGRNVVVYAGNMGVAQGIDAVLELALRVRHRTDIGFLLVGRGSEAGRLKEEAAARNLENVLFFDEIEPDEIPDLYSQCVAGLVVLDPRHRSHNIPGKFLTYMQSGLPVLALVNPGNDLVDLIRSEDVGVVSEGRDSGEWVTLLERLLCHIQTDASLPDRCRRLFTREYTAEAAARRIVSALSR